ncbi:MAG: hypothetical protein AAGA87_01765 [Pseudomonadota bacterium]
MAIDTDTAQEAFRKADGMGYRRFLQEMHGQVAFDWYMEVGCRSGRSFAPVRSATIAVDPHFSINADVVGEKPALHIFQQTSDAFFESRFLQKNGIRLGLSFLDGMHLIEFLLRDFIATEAASAPDGITTIHDCCPFSHEMTTRDLDNLPGGAWTGDVWKILPILQTYRDDLKIDVLDCRRTGLVVVSNLDPKSTVLRERYDDILTVYQRLSLQAFGVDRLFDSFTYRSARDEARAGFPLFQQAARAEPVTGRAAKVTP